MFEPTGRAMCRMLCVLICGEIMAAYGFLSMSRDTSFGNEFIPTDISLSSM